MIELKNRIQELRKARKVTQQELADALSVTRQTIISLENGRYNASLTLAHKAAQFFGITIEELFIFEDGENYDEFCRDTYFACCQVQMFR